MIGFLQNGWRKFALLGLLSLTLVFMYMSRSSLMAQVGVLEDRLVACTHHAEALSSQLEVINHHKEKVEAVLKNVREEQVRALQMCKSRISTLQRDCMTDAKTKSLAEENASMKARIAELQQQLTHQEQNVNQTGNAQVAPDAVANSPTETKNAVLPPPNAHANEAEVYAKGPNVHFHRKRPMDEPLEFHRDLDREPKLEDWMGRKELVKKLDERKQNKDHVEQEDPQADFDFRDLAKPDAQEEDYKDMH